MHRMMGKINTSTSLQHPQVITCVVNRMDTHRVTRLVGPEAVSGTSDDIWLKERFLANRHSKVHMEHSDVTTQFRLHESMIISAGVFGLTHQYEFVKCTKKWHIDTICLTCALDSSVRQNMAATMWVCWRTHLCNGTQRGQQRCGIIEVEMLATVQEDLKQPHIQSKFTNSPREAVPHHINKCDMPWIFWWDQLASTPYPTP